MASPHTISARALTKRYKQGILAVDGLDLDIRQGEIYGLLGPNGAGKTTTLRMLLGLIPPSSGTATVLGEPPGAPAGLARLGALVEEPAFYPYLSGRDNLRVLARYGGVDPDRVEPAVAVVGLTERGNDKVSRYSLGMRQRLGVAAALLKDPQLLILDEPTNGLDPMGMAEMRRLLRTLGTGTRTVILSSHLLGEVEQVCDRVGVINQGRLVAEGSVEELRGMAGIVIAAEPLGRARSILEDLVGAESIRDLDGHLHVAVDPARAADLNERLVGSGVRVSELRTAQRSLEDVFLHLTGGLPTQEEVPA